MTSLLNQRVLVIGTSGSGKTTLALKISSKYNLKHTQLDSIFWRENWEQIDKPIFKERVAEFIQDDSWVIDGNHTTVQELVLKRATVVIWLNYNFSQVFYRTFIRTLKRIYTKEILFSYNRETFKQSFFSTNSILLWVIKSYGKHKVRYRRLFNEKPYPSLTYIEIINQTEADSLFH